MKLKKLIPLLVPRHTVILHPNNDDDSDMYGEVDMIPYYLINRRVAMLVPMQPQLGDSAYEIYLYPDNKK